MSLAHRVLAVLVNAETPLGPIAIMDKSGVDRNSVGNTLTRLVKDGRITKHAHGLYSMTEAQRSKFDYLRAPAHPPTGTFGKGIAAADLSRRLHFLTGVSHRPAFEGNALLGEIINDYRQALDRGTGQEDAE
ncbi:hypothetical protein CAL26_23830 [Bordetella genomosp. 9]|uniref:MarR family transcriptional regulator n=1 Tax=Bordetella genomosp. 9 TaxID=1416803 RepID=A0A261R670_9BORD|nr:hypothetical protein [Bordetella genomosp. 9]OZI20528.1 hypothetical protein CAL26_23830 [Bordetella genomosp. 9]